MDASYSSGAARQIWILGMNAPPSRNLASGVPIGVERARAINGKAKAMKRLWNRICAAPLADTGALAARGRPDRQIYFDDQITVISLLKKQHWHTAWACIPFA